MFNSQQILYRIAAAAIFFLSVSIATDAKADCDGVLRDGVFNELRVNHTDYSKMFLAYRFSQMTAQEARQHINNGTTVILPDGTPLTNEFTDDQFNSWKQSVQSSFSAQSSHFEDTSVFQLSASPEILTAWTNCMNGQHGIVDTTKADDATNVFFTVRFVASGAVTQATVENSIDIQNATATSSSQLAQFSEGKTINAAQKSVHLKRVQSRQPITITLNTTEGSVTRYVPPILPIPPFPHPTAPPVPDLSKQYWITSVSTGWQLNVYAGAFTVVAAPLCVAPATPHHKWHFVGVGPSTFNIVEEVGGLVVGRLSATNTNGDAIVLAPPNVPTQAWQLVSAGNNRYRIRAVNSDIYIAIGAEGQPPHRALHQGPSDEAEMWTLSEQGSWPP